MYLFPASPRRFVTVVTGVTAVIAVIGYDLGANAEFMIPRVSSIDLGDISAQEIDVIRNAAPGEGLLAVQEQGFTLAPRESCGHAASTA
ncbi:hypothetical protein [Nonomuraea sp. NPDC003201]